MMKLYVLLGVSLITLGSVSAGYFWYSQDKIASLEEVNVELKLTNELNKDTIETLQENYKELKTVHTTLENAFKTASNQNKLLEEKINKHDLNLLANKKPTLVEKRINKATNNVFLCFEYLSGAVLSEEEKNELKKSPSDCPNFTYD